MFTIHSMNGRSQLITGVQFICIRQPCKAPITSYCSFYQRHLANERLSRPLGGSRVRADLLLFVPEFHLKPLSTYNDLQVSGGSNPYSTRYGGSALSVNYQATL